MKTAILFAGQGSQYVGMGKDLYEKFPAFKAVYDALPEQKRLMAFEGPEEELSDTKNTQIILSAFGAGVWEIIKPVLKKGGAYPEMGLGLSLGEYTALYAAGALDLDGLFEVLTLRGEKMAESSYGGDWGMSAVLGLDGNTLKSCCEEAERMDLGHVAPTNFNCPGQIVISGEKEAVEKACGLAMDAGAKRCMALKVSGPFHTKFMEPAAEALKLKFAGFKFGEMNFPIVFNALGRTKKAGESIENIMVSQVTNSVLLEDSLKFMAENGVDSFIEIGPGKALSGFVKKTVKDARVYSINTPEDIEGLEAFLKNSGAEV